MLTIFSTLLLSLARIIAVIWKKELTAFPISRENVAANDGFPMREWSIRIFVLGPGGEEMPASLFDKVTYKLHPTFTNPTRGSYINIHCV